MLVRLGDPRVVPCFHCMFLLDMSPSTTPGSSSAANTQFLADNIGLRHRLTGSALPSTPPSASGGGGFRGFTGLPCYNLSSGLPPLADPTGSPADRGFYSWASIGSVTLPDARYNYGGNWAISTGGTLTRWNSS